MGKSRRYHPGFVADLSAATNYYDSISAELGNRFRLAVRERLTAVADSPRSFGKIYENARAVRISRFPYVLLFQDADKMVIILGIKHAASDRGTWFARK